MNFQARNPRKNGGIDFWAYTTLLPCIMSCFCLQITEQILHRAHARNCSKVECLPSQISPVEVSITGRKKCNRGREREKIPVKHPKIAASRRGPQLVPTRRRRIRRGKGPGSSGARRRELHLASRRGVELITSRLRI